MESINFSKFSYVVLVVWLFFGGSYAYAETQSFDFALSQETQTEGEELIASADALLTDLQ